MKIATAFLLIGLLFSCAATSKQFRPIASSKVTIDKAKLCVFSEYKSIGSANGTDVWDGDDLVASVGPGCYVAWEREIGSVKLRVREAGLSLVRISSLLEFNVLGGETYLVMIEPTFYGKYQIKQIDSEEGMALFNKYKRPKYIEK